MRPSKRIAISVVDLNTLDDSPSPSEVTGLKAETELDFIFQQMAKYPPLKPEEERQITRKIFDCKIKVLTAIATTEPTFIHYLNIMIELADDANQSDQEFDEFEDDEESSTRFEHYLNSVKDSVGQKRKFSEFKSMVLVLKKLCMEIYSIKSPLKYEAKKEEITQVLAEINFSWSRLEKDGLFEMLSPKDQNLLEFRRTVDKMFNHNLRLSVDVAKHFFSFNGHHADLIQEANRGLLVSIQRFDPRRGFKFSTFAYRWIKQHVGRFASQFWTIRVPVHMNEKLFALRSMEKDHPEWGEEQLAEKMKCTVEHVRKLRLIRHQTTVSYLDEPVNNDPSKDGADTIGTFMTDPDVNVEQAILDVITHDQMVKIMKERLTAREYEIMARRLGLEDYDEETLDQIGKFFRVSRERICQLEKEAITKLRSLKFFQQLRIA